MKAVDRETLPVVYFMWKSAANLRILFGFPLTDQRMSSNLLDWARCLHDDKTTDRKPVLPSRALVINNATTQQCLTLLKATVYMQHMPVCI